MASDLYYFKDGSVSEDDDEDKVLHRMDGPAMILTSPCHVYIDEHTVITGPAQAWFCENQLHREDGPAVEEEGQDPRYFVVGLEMSREEFRRVQLASEKELKNFVSRGSKAESWLARKRLATISK